MFLLFRMILNKNNYTHSFRIAIEIISAVFLDLVFEQNTLLEYKSKKNNLIFLKMLLITINL